MHSNCATTGGIHTQWRQRRVVSARMPTLACNLCKDDFGSNHHAHQTNMKPSPEDEAALVAGAQGGDESAFMMLIQHYKPRILSKASRFGRDPEEVRDLAQEISLELWKGIRGYNGKAPFEHWLSRVATNRCLRFLRRNYRRRSMEIVGTGNATDDSSDRADSLEDHAATRHRQATEARELLALAMTRLPAKDALIITLREVEGKSFADIARDTGWSEANVKVRAHRVRLKLRKILEDLGEA